MGLVWVLASSAESIPLAEQVPALVELHLDLVQPGMLFGLADLTLGQLLAKALLLGDQTGDALVNSRSLLMRRV